MSLDLTGRLPSPESVRAFLADARPSRVKRAKMIDKLIASPEYVDHWTVKWGDLLQSSRKYLGEKGAYEFQQWIRDAIASNRPYDKLVRELLTARGSSYDNPAANYFRVTREAKPAMEKTTQVFLGVRMVCAQCHDHPFERWTQNQYYQMSAFFSAVGIRAGFEVGEEIVFDQRADYEMKHPKDGRVMKPQFMLASGVAPVPDGPQRRDALGGMAHLQGQSVLCQGDRQPDVELFRRQGHHRSGGRHSRVQSAVESGAVGRADEGFRGARFRFAPPDAHHRQLPDVSGVHRDQRVERHRPRQLLPCHSAASFRGGADGRGRPRRRAPGRDSPKFPRTRPLRSWSTRTSAERGFWTCSDVRRGSRPASASGAPISASRRR